MKNLQTFEEFLNESREVHYYGVQDMEKLAAQAEFNLSFSRFASADTLVRRVKQYFLKPDVLEKLSDGKVSVTKNSKRSFHIITKSTFDMNLIEDSLIDFAERFMKMEGPYGVRITLLKPNDILIELDLEKGITIVK